MMRSTRDDVQYHVDSRTTLMIMVRIWWQRCFEAGGRHAWSSSSLLLFFWTTHFIKNLIPYRLLDTWIFSIMSVSYKCYFWLNLWSFFTDDRLCYDTHDAIFLWHLEPFKPPFIFLLSFAKLLWASIWNFISCYLVTNHVTVLHFKCNLFDFTWS